MAELRRLDLPPLPGEPEPDPAVIDWDRWLGPSPLRPYNKKYVEGRWRGHYAFHGGRGGGTSATDDGKVSVRLSVPKAMGGDDGPGTNPEQLFAVGYSACFLGALRYVAGKEKVTVPAEATVAADVWMRPCVSVAGTRCTRWPPRTSSW